MHHRLAGFSFKEVEEPRRPSETDELARAHASRAAADGERCGVDLSGGGKEEQSFMGVDEARVRRSGGVQEASRGV